MNEFISIKPENFPGETLAKSLGYPIPAPDHSDYKYQLPEGVEVKEFIVIDPNELTTHEKANQTRNKGLDAENLLSIKSDMETKGRLDNPLFATRDPVTSAFAVESGHHRHENAIVLGWEEVPVFVLAYTSRKDGLNPREEFLQAQNNHPANKRHTETDGLHYLNKVKNETTYFDAAEAITDKKDKRKKLKKLAGELLNRHYSSYTPQKRGGMVKKFLNGITTTKLKPYNGSLAKKYFEKNKVLDKIGAYNPHENAIDYIFQNCAYNSYIGNLAGLLRTARSQAKEDEAVDDDKFLKKIKKVKIRAGVYVDVKKIDEHEDLEKQRKKAIEELAIINKDDVFAPNILIEEVCFAPQCFTAPDEFTNRAPHFKWNFTTQSFDQVQENS